MVLGCAYYELFELCLYSKELSLYPHFVFTASNGVVLATEKKQKSILYDEQSVHKVEPITKHIGMVYSGMGPDYRYGFGAYMNKRYIIMILNMKHV